MKRMSFSQWICEGTNHCLNSLFEKTQWIREPKSAQNGSIFQIIDKGEKSNLIKNEQKILVFMFCIEISIQK